MEIRGTVIEGNKYGRSIGFPTTNLDHQDYVERSLDVRLGVYAGFVTRVKTGRIYKAGIVIGPLNESGLPHLEAHLLDFDETIYGEELVYNLHMYLRPFQDYGSEEALKEAIAVDIKTVTRLALPNS